MTSFDMLRLGCPRCGAEMQDRALASTNNFGWVQRSDGFGHGTYFHPENRLRSCAQCGQLFLWNEHVVRGKPPLRDPLWAPRRTVGMPSSKPAVGRRWPWVRRSSPEETVAPEAPWSPPEILPKAGRLTPDQLEDALSQLDGSESAEFEVEVRLWCFWNRNEQRGDFEPADPLAPPDDNTVRLLELLPPEPDAAVLIRGQALRDLGRFDEAAEVYGRMPADSSWRALLIQLAHGRRRDVIANLADAAVATAEKSKLIGSMEAEAAELEAKAQRNRAEAAFLEAEAVHLEEAARKIHAEVAKLKAEL